MFERGGRGKGGSEREGGKEGERKREMSIECKLIMHLPSLHQNIVGSLPCHKLNVRSEKGGMV